MNSTPTSPSHVNAQNLDSILETHRYELQVHCYRMLGSFQDAEDHVQETFLRAWKRLDSYEGRASFRAWLYKIATNACLDTLKQQKRRGLPTDTHPPANADEPFAPPTNEFLWLEPYPNSYISGLSPNPEARYSTQESVRLAFLKALQTLPPRQRAVLILRDVLDWRAKEAAAALDLSVSSVNSALNRARVKMNESYGQQNQPPVQPDDSATSQLLDKYVHFWENADVAGLVSLFKQDVSFAMPPSPSWYSGETAVFHFLSGIIPSASWKLRPTSANGQAAFGLYRLAADGGLYVPFAIQVITPMIEGIGEIVTFLLPELFEAFRLVDRIQPAN